MFNCYERRAWDSGALDQAVCSARLSTACTRAPPPPPPLHLSPRMLDVVAPILVVLAHYRQNALIFTLFRTSDRLRSGSRSTSRPGSRSGSPTSYIYRREHIVQDPYHMYHIGHARAQEPCRAGPTRKNTIWTISYKYLFTRGLYHTSRII